jgi:hypothetical protein
VKSSLGRSVLVFLATLAASLVALELVFRTFLLAPDFKFEDPELGPMNRPQVRAVYTREGFGVHHTNALGFFSPELRAERPRLRVLVLGSSFAEALQIAPDESFSAVAQSLVEDSEFVNAAQSGWLPAPCLVLLRRVYPTVRPDVVVLQVSGVNPFDAGPIHVERDGAAGFRIVLRDQRFGLEQRLKAALDGIASRSSLVTMLLERANQVQADQRARLRERVFGATAAAGPAPPNESEREEAFRFVLREMSEITGRIVVLYVPELSYSVGGCVSVGQRDVAAVRAVAADLGLPVIDPSDALCAEYRSTGQPLHGFHNGVMGEGHLNAAGHRVVGRLVAQAVGSAR